MSRRRYNAEYKSEAVKLLLIDGMTVREASKQLGVSEGLLYKWKHDHLNELEQSKPAGAQSPKALAEENAKLRKDLARERRMNEILKKTVGYFSKDE